MPTTPVLCMQTQPHQPAFGEGGLVASHCVVPNLPADSAIYPREQCPLTYLSTCQQKGEDSRRSRSSQNAAGGCGWGCTQVLLWHIRMR